MKKLCMILPLALILCIMVSCQDKETMAEFEEQNASDILPGFLFSEPSPNSDGLIKIFVLTDMEGLSGIDHWKMVKFWYPEQYKKGQEFLTAEVNAVIEGIFDGGADVVYVLDAHGSGNPDPNIILEQLDSRATFLYKEKLPEGKSHWNYDVYDGTASTAFCTRS